MGKKSIDREEALKDVSLEVEEVEEVEEVDNIDYSDEEIALTETAINQKVVVVVRGRLWRLIGGSHSFHCPQTGKFVTIRKGDLVRIEADTYDELPPWAKGKVQVAVVV
jgi:hypothetical protein